MRLLCTRRAWKLVGIWVRSSTVINVIPAVRRGIRCVLIQSGLSATRRGEKIPRMLISSGKPPISVKPISSAIRICRNRARKMRHAIFAGTDLIFNPNSTHKYSSILCSLQGAKAWKPSRDIMQAATASQSQSALLAFLHLFFQVQVQHFRHLAHGIVICIDRRHEPLDLVQLHQDLLTLRVLRDA